MASPAARTLLSEVTAATLPNQSRLGLWVRAAMTEGCVLSDTLAVLGREHTIAADFYTSWALMRAHDDVERLLAALVPLSMVCQLSLLGMLCSWVAC